MRVWGYADPRLLAPEHLLAEHREVHALLNTDYNWSTNPEALDNRYKGHITFLIFRHEILRIGMNLRWQGQHAHIAHPTPVDLMLMRPGHQKLVHHYERLSLKIGHYEEFDYDFRDLAGKAKFPRTKLEGRADTPWERDGISLKDYLSMPAYRRLRTGTS